MWAWFIPFISLIRPYQVVNELHRALEPDRVAPPAPRVDPTAAGDYRSVTFIQPSPPTKVPSALVGMWWGAFLVMTLGSRLVSMTSSRTDMSAAGVITAYRGMIFVSGAAVVAAGLAITVVRGLTARAIERHRRLRESAPEALIAQGIELEGV